jgi:hypothetical protein
MKLLKGKPKYVKIALDQLALLCLNVDYMVSGETLDMIEELSNETVKIIGALVAQLIRIHGPLK